MPPEPVVLLMLAIVLGIGARIAQRRPDSARERDLAALAARLGLRYSRHDPFDLETLPFEILRTRGERWASSVLWGAVGGMPLTSFEWRRVDLPQVGERVIPRAYSAVMTTLPMDAPQVVVERRSRAAHRLGPALGEAPAMATESNEFDRAFQIRTNDPAFALAVLDPAMMGWLLDAPSDWNFELHGAHLFAYAPLRPVSEIEPLILTLRQVRDRMPAHARELAPREGDPAWRRGTGRRRPRRPTRVWDVIGAAIAIPVVIVTVALYGWWTLFELGIVEEPWRCFFPC